MAKESKSVQAKFDEFIQYVRMELDKSGRKVLHVGGQWYEYHAGAWSAWTALDREVFDVMLYDLSSLHEFPYATQKSALWTTLQAAMGSRKVIEFDAVPMIVCNSKTYFLDENKLKKHSPDHYATRRVFLDVDPKATCPKWLVVLDRMFDGYSAEMRAENIQFLKEWMGVAIVGGAAVQNRRDMRKGLFLFGDKGTGKSSIADLLTILLGGSKRIACPSIASLSTRFGLEPLIGKAAIITNEAADARTTADSNTLKCLITGDTLQADRKNLGAVPFEWHGPVLFTTNNLPTIHDDSDALYDRTVVLEFTRQFTAADVVTTLEGYPNVIKYLEGTDQLPGILNWCLEGYDEVQERKRILIPSSAASAGERFKRKNDKVFDFLRACCELDVKTGCSSASVALACVEYVRVQHDTAISVDTAKRSLAKSVRSAIPGVISEQGYHSKEQFAAYNKLRLNEAGVKCLEVACTKPHPDAKRALKHFNYGYG